MVWPDLIGAWVWHATDLIFEKLEPRLCDEEAPSVKSAKH